MKTDARIKNCFTQAEIHYIPNENANLNLDSLSLAMLIIELESEFKIKIPVIPLNKNHYRSLAAIKKHLNELGIS